jgi:hypothetical protein
MNSNILRLFKVSGQYFCNPREEADEETRTITGAWSSAAKPFPDEPGHRAIAMFAELPPVNLFASCEPHPPRRGAPIPTLSAADVKDIRQKWLSFFDVFEEITFCDPDIQEQVLTATDYRGSTLAGRAVQYGLDSEILGRFFEILNEFDLDVLEMVCNHLMDIIEDFSCDVRERILTSANKLGVSFPVCLVRSVRDPKILLRLFMMIDKFGPNARDEICSRIIDVIPELSYDMQKQLLTATDKPGLPFALRISFPVTAANMWKVPCPATAVDKWRGPSLAAAAERQRISFQIFAVRSVRNPEIQTLLFEAINKLDSVTLESVFDENFMELIFENVKDLDAWIYVVKNFQEIFSKEAWDSSSLPCYLRPETWKYPIEGFNLPE